MQAPNLASDRDASLGEIDRLRSLVQSIEPLQVQHKKLIAEMIVVRLFIIIENLISRTCKKILCEAVYLDGTIPLRLVIATSMSNAQHLMASHQRTRDRALRWGNSRDIRQNISHTIDPKDPIVDVVSTYASFVTDIRYVRNHIAHRNPNTQANFRKVVRSYYGGLKRGTTPGLLLLTTATRPVPLVISYLTFARALVQDLLRA